MSKRERKLEKFASGHKSNNQMWPFVFCPNEGKVIGLSYKPLAIKVDKAGIVKRDKVHYSYWGTHNSEFLEGYRIDFTKLREGEPVACPVCGNLVDFRIIISAKKPDFVK